VSRGVLRAVTIESVASSINIGSPVRLKGLFLLNPRGQHGFAGAALSELAAVEVMRSQAKTTNATKRARF
jgi:hypothetical protein